MSCTYAAGLDVHPSLEVGTCRSSSESIHVQPAVVLKLLTTLNSHLSEDGLSVAIEMYSKPKVSNEMKSRISDSHILANNILK